MATGLCCIFWSQPERRVAEKSLNLCLLHPCSLEVGHSLKGRTHLPLLQELPVLEKATGLPSAVLTSEGSQKPAVFQAHIVLHIYFLFISSQRATALCCRLSLLARPMRMLPGTKCCWYFMANLQLPNCPALENRRLLCYPPPQWLA